MADREQKKPDFKGLVNEGFLRILERLEEDDPTFTTLLYSGSNIGPIEAEALGDAMADEERNQDIVSMSLWGNNMGNEGAAKLARGLRLGSGTE